MKTLGGIAVLSLVSFTSGLDPLSYWVHRSCLDRPGNFFYSGMATAQQMARNALSMLRSHDENDYSIFVFVTIFNAVPLQEEEGVQAISDRLEEIFTAFVGMADMTPQSNIPIGNFRYYCDNDMLDGSSRWQLRLDPPSFGRPAGYIPQILRRMSGREPAPYQEWWDPVNKIMMGDTRGCQSPGIFAQTYDPTPTQASYPGYPRLLIRATVTLCERLMTPLAADLDGRIAGLDQRNAIDPLTPLLVTSTGPNILRQFCHSPPWKLRDIRGYSWHAIININSPFDRIRNVNNIVFYAALAWLRHRGWCLASRMDLLRQGRLYRCGGEMPGIDELEEWEHTQDENSSQFVDFNDLEDLGNLEDTSSGKTQPSEGGEGDKGVEGDGDRQGNGGNYEEFLQAVAEFGGF